MKIFISYRRSVSSDIVGRLRDVLVHHFGENEVFMDVYSIDVGLDFRVVIRDEIAQVDALVLVIGPQFDAQRLHEESDALRTEIHEALRQGKLVLPVLHGGAVMPSASELPEQIRNLAFLNAGRLRSDPDFPHDAEAVVRRLLQSSGGSDDAVALPPPIALLGRRRRNPAWLLPAAVGVIALAIAATLIVALSGGAETKLSGPSSPATNSSATNSSMSLEAGTPATPATPATSPNVASEAPVAADPNVIASEGNERAGANDESEVKRIQSWLVDVGLVVTADGRFGPKTASAVKEFQQSAGLEVTGAVDALTYETLQVVAENVTSTITLASTTVDPVEIQVLADCADAFVQTVAHSRSDPSFDAHLSESLVMANELIDPAYRSYPVRAIDGGCFGNAKVVLVLVGPLPSTDFARQVCLQLRQAERQAVTADPNRYPSLKPSGNPPTPSAQELAIYRPPGESSKPCD